MNKPMTPAALFNAALEKVESRSIREWANSDRNRPHWIAAVKDFKPNPALGADPVTALAAYIVITAMG